MVALNSKAARLHGALEERWTDYLRLREQDAHYAAFVRLGEIANCVRYADLSSQDRSKWANVLEQTDISPDVLGSIKVEARSKIERLWQIIGGGGVYVYEEAVLVITLRVQLGMLLDYLAQRGVVDFLDVKSVDEQLQALASAPENSSAFRSARQSARRNWGLPLRSRWLDTDGMH
jgi:hypothetical protein